MNFILYPTLVILLGVVSHASLFGWILDILSSEKQFDKLMTQSKNDGIEVSSLDDSEVQARSDIHFELTVADEKFISDAQKFTDLNLSDLDLCQHKLILQLKQACDELTEEDLSKLGVNLLNCQSKLEGRKVFPCSSTMTLKECTIEMDSDTWNAYHILSNRARSVCYGARQQQFRALTQMTVNKLMLASNEQLGFIRELKVEQEELNKGQEKMLEQQEYLKVTQQVASQQISSTMKELSRLTDNSIKAAQTLEDNILKTQKKSLAQQEQLLEKNSQLGLALEMSKSSVEDIVHEFRSSTSEQRNLIFEVFDRLSNLQNLFIGEVSGFYSLIFYPIAFFAVYFMTSTCRTAAARLWLLAVMVISLALERICIADLAVNDMPADEASKEIYWRIWIFRKAVVAFCIALLAHFAYSFQDLPLIMYGHLLGIQLQLREQNGLLRFAFENTNRRMMSAEPHDLSSDDETNDGTYVPQRYRYNLRNRSRLRPITASAAIDETPQSFFNCLLERQGLRDARRNNNQ